MGEKVNGVIFLLVLAGCVAMIWNISGCKRADKVATENMCRNYCELKIGHLVEMSPPDFAQDGCTGSDEQVLTRTFKVVWLKKQPYCQCVVRVLLPHILESTNPKK